MIPVAGLFGKLPGRGDFVRHGWDDSVVDALDAWLSEGLAAWRPEDDAVFAEHFAAAPLYTFYTPPSWFGTALHGVISPSVDRAGRYFFLVAGIGGDAPAVWHAALNQPGFAAAAEAGVYAALGTASDPETLAAELAAAVPDGLDSLSWRAALAVPETAIFWAEDHEGGDPVVVRAARPDAQLLANLLDGGVVCPA